MYYSASKLRIPNYLQRVDGREVNIVKRNNTLQQHGNKNCINGTNLEKKYDFNTLTSNDNYRGRTASLTSKRYILYIYSKNRGTEYFKHGIYSACFSLKNAVFVSIILKYLVPVLFTLCIQGVLKLKNIIPAPKG